MAHLLRDSTSPIVLDADALNIIAKNRELLQIIPSSAIITPHPKEFDRLTGTSKNSWARLDKAIEMAAQYKIIIVLKGAHTAVVMPSGKVSFNNTGNPGMATAGSGDVLTGIIGSLLSQGYSSSEAAMLGVYVHGKAGDLGSESLGQHGLIASDIINHLPTVFKDFE